MCVITPRYRGDVDGPDKVPPAPVARSIAASSDSLHLPAAGTRGEREGAEGKEFGGLLPSRPQRKGGG